MEPITCDGIDLLRLDSGQNMLSDPPTRESVYAVESSS